MRFKMFAMAVAVLCLITGAALAADITGTWVAEMSGGPGGGGPGGGGMQITFNFKADGSKLTGTSEAMGNSNEIVDGTIDGNNISFAVKIDMMGNEMKINYKGTVSGDEIKLTMSFEGGMGGPGGAGGGAPKPMELIAKRQK
jgi:opacity protein-like surface antigen